MLLTLTSQLFTKHILKGTESTRFYDRGTSKPERQNERPVPYLKQYDTPASHSLSFLKITSFLFTSLYEHEVNEVYSFDTMKY